MIFFIHLIHYKVYLTALKNSNGLSREHTVLMYSTAYNLWTFTWSELRLKGTEKIHTEGLTKLPSNIYSILFGRMWELSTEDFCSISGLTDPFYLAIFRG